MKIRLATADDLAAIVAIHNAAMPGIPVSVEMIHGDDVSRPDYVRHRRLVAEVNGALVGFGEYDQVAHRFDPHRFVISLAVPPHWQGEGIGRALYDQVVADLEPLEPHALLTAVHDLSPRGRRFAEDRGYELAMSFRQSRLDLTTFDPACFAETTRRVADTGIQITDVTTLLESDPDSTHKLWRLEAILDRDVPGTEPVTGRPYESWYVRRMENPELLREGWMVALDGDDYIGESNIFEHQGDPTTVHTGLTGVVPEYRRRGIAVAVKVASLGWAKERGYQAAQTTNASHNVAMIAVNDLLGFVPIPSGSDWVKTIVS